MKEDLSFFQSDIQVGIPDELPPRTGPDTASDHAPRRQGLSDPSDVKLALQNALRYFPPHFHAELAPEFLDELKRFGRIYMYRFRPSYPMFARPIDAYPAKCRQAAAIMLMIQNNLDPSVAQHPDELITYGGNGSVFQNWAQYRLTMKYLSMMEENQTLVMYSGHPLGLFPSNTDAPRVVVTNGLMIPNYSKTEHWERFNALGVTQFGQMTAGSFMYIGPQGIVHGTTITLQEARRRSKSKGRLFVSSGLGGMSGAQPKAAKIAGLVSIVAEINPLAATKRHNQGWVDVLCESPENAIEMAMESIRAEQSLSIAFVGNIADLWEKLAELHVDVDFGSDQTSLHNPFSGGYYPAGFTLEESRQMMHEQPEKFRQAVYASLCRQVDAINKITERGMYFFDYGNAFLLEASRAGADIFNATNRGFRYNSYVQDMMGPRYFDHGFGPFRWICSSGDPEDLAITDKIASDVIRKMMPDATPDIYAQLEDNLRWIESAGKNQLVVGSQARILYADSDGRINISAAFNKAIRDGLLKAPVILGRDHHDVSGTDSPWRETSNIYDGSQFTADMAVQNFAGDSFRGATWVSLHNGGGTGWGEAINGGFGLVLDGTPEADRRLTSMLHWDVNNGIARRAWARNQEAITSIKRAMEKQNLLQVTLPNQTDESLLDKIINQENPTIS